MKRGARSFLCFLALAFLFLPGPERSAVERPAVSLPVLTQALQAFASDIAGHDQQAAIAGMGDAAPPAPASFVRFWLQFFSAGVEEDQWSPDQPMRRTLLNPCQMVSNSS